MRKKRKRKRMRLPSIDAIGIIMSNDFSSEYCLSDFCPKCMKTIFSNSNNCHTCGNHLISARPFLTCTNCLTENGYGEFCKKCGEPLEKFQYIRDMNDKSPLLNQFKLNLEYKGECKL